MSDFSIRSRRRVEDCNSKLSTRTFDDHDTKKESASTSSSFFGNYNPLNSVSFGASSVQLWNSAQVNEVLTIGVPHMVIIDLVQEAFSNIQSPLQYSRERLNPSDFVEEFPVLSVFGNPVDIIAFTMPSRDRTAEFKTTCKSLQMKGQPNGFVFPTRKEILNDSVQFNQLAKRIGRDLSQTCGKMEKLAELAKRRSLFDERSDMDHLSKVIKEVRSRTMKEKPVA
uniref:Syntaxin-5_N domain-containing protein n=1 Tax=Angiostrongylus cantonensis TaxID=6313 RepID=A0A0K0CT00_ANGCA